MPVLIDGDNLLHAARDMGDPDRLVGRSMLCDSLGAWARRQDERVHIVFDGVSPDPALASQIGHPAIQVSYSGAGVSADSVIADLLTANSAARRVLVVSTDREVRQAARRRRAHSMRSDDFWRQVQRDLSRREPRVAEPDEKRTGPAPDEVDDWLRRFDPDHGG
jgi:predicted RNA-binding protein with PIN domain